MDFDFEFDLNEVEETGNVVPKGKYPVQVEEAELRETNDGTGNYINVMFTIIGEKYNGRKLFDQFNIKNKSEEAVKIGLGRIKNLIKASGADLQKFTSPDQIVGLECQALVKIEEDDYGEKNRIGSFSKMPNEAMTMADNVGESNKQAAGNESKGSSSFSGEINKEDIPF